MRYRLLLTILIMLLIETATYAAQSTITDIEGSACMGDDKSRKQTEQAAITDAKRRAVEFTSTYIKSATEVKDFVVEKDLLAAYANAEVKIIQELEKVWYKDAATGDCYKVKIKAEVIPDVKAMKKAVQARNTTDNPSALLNVQLWTDKQSFKQKEKIKIYLKGNKPFYARVLYKDASGNLLQLLPNPYRTDNYFNGGVVYEIPSGNDRFELEVTPPFGQEDIMITAATSPLGDINLGAQGDVYRVVSKPTDVPMLSRGLKIQKIDGNKQAVPSEFSEDKLSIKTGQ